MLRDLLSLCLATMPPARPDGLFAYWSLAPETLVPLGVFAALYVRGRRRLAASGRGAVADVRLFAAGWLLLAAALVSPLCRLAATLVSAHMLQLMLIVIPAAFLLARGGAVEAVRAAFGTLGSAQPWLSRPGPAAAGHGLAIWIAHAPPVYAAALTGTGAHLAVLAMLVATGIWFWHAVGIADVQGRGRALGAILVTMMHTGILGAVLTFAPRPFYPVQGPGAALWGLGTLEDQQLAGLLMWVPGSTLYLAIAVVVGVRWLQSAAERDAARG
ncbi:MAG: cytochrome c oxidase assembly protein [Alphaproteobacteria bacterium]